MAAPPGWQIEALLAEALAQYRAHPSDCLEGVVIGLMRMLAREPDRSWRDLQAQERGTRPATTRLRDYLNGNQAAIMWVTGSSTSPPIQFLLADNPPRTQGTQQ